MNNTLESINKEFTDNVILFPTNKEPVQKGDNHSQGAVDPIKDMEILNQIKDELLHKQGRYSTNKFRDYTLFILGINIARRIGDLLNIKIKDILDDNGNIKDYYYFKSEQKTGKSSDIKLNADVKNVLKQYLEYRKAYEGNYSPDEYLFNSLKPNKEGEYKLSRQQAWRIISGIGKEYGLHLGTHSMRKTKGYQYAVNHKNDVYSMQKLVKFYNHSGEAMTRHYIGLDQEAIDEVADYTL